MLNMEMLWRSVPPVCIICKNPVAACVYGLTDVEINLEFRIEIGTYYNHAVKEARNDLKLG